MIEDIGGAKANHHGEEHMLTGETGAISVLDYHAWIVKRMKKSTDTAEQYASAPSH